MVNILSLDGGGTWALIQTRALAALYPGESGHQILSRFDYAFANSGGSIVLGGLLSNMSPAEIEGYFTNSKHREAMYVPFFGPLTWLLKRFGAGPRYRTAAKHKKLRDVFGNEPFETIERPGGRSTKAVVVAFDYVRQRAFFFRSHPSRRSPTVLDLSIADAVHASSTAPVLYYDKPAGFEVCLHYPGVNTQPTTMQFWDGGVTGLNNPVAAAVAEAIADGAKADEIAVLCIGTGTVMRSNNRNHSDIHGDQVAPAHEVSNPFGDITKLAKAVIGDPPDFASFLAHTMTGGRGPDGEETVEDTRIVRLSPLVLGDYDRGQWVRPRWNEGADPKNDLFRRLSRMDMDAASDGDVDDIGKLADAWLADRAWNQPIRVNFFQEQAAGWHAEIGHKRFSKAKAAAHDLGLVPPDRPGDPTSQDISDAMLVP